MTPLIHLINIIIICFLNYLNLAYYLLHQSDYTRSSVLWPSFCSFFIIFNFIYFLLILYLITFSALQNGFNRKWITMFFICVIELLLMMIMFYLSKMKTNLNKFAFIAY